MRHDMCFSHLLSFERIHSESRECLLPFLANGPIVVELLVEKRLLYNVIRNPPVSAQNSRLEPPLRLDVCLNAPSLLSHSTAAPRFTRRGGEPDDAVRFSLWTVCGFWNKETGLMVVSRFRQRRRRMTGWRG